MHARHDTHAADVLEMRVGHVLHNLDDCHGAEEHRPTLALLQRRRGDDARVFPVHAASWESQYAARLRAGVVTGRLRTGNDAPALASALLALIDDRARRRALGTAARACDARNVKRERAVAHFREVCACALQEH